VSIKVKVILRSTVSRSVYPGVRPPSGNLDKTLFSFFLEIILGKCGFADVENLFDERTVLQFAVDSVRHESNFSLVRISQYS
jgi:hypothetical protein